MSNPIRLAIVGAGIFAREAHTPAILTLPDQFKIVAVCSRSMSSVEQLAAKVPYPVDKTSDYEALLARSDIDAVDLSLPIELMPKMVEAALKAGKHVISEKPATPTVAIGRQMLALQHEPIWMVAENWRYDQAIQQAAEIIKRGEIGKPIVAHWALHIAAQNDVYFGTAWRRDNSFPGGFLLDGGVHHIAGLRILLGEIESVSAYTAQNHEGMPPTDTLAAALKFANGCLGSYVITYMSNSPFDEMITIVGTQGSLKVHANSLDLSGVPGHRGEGKQRLNVNTIAAEFADFAEAIQNKRAPIATAAEAVQDVAVIEAMLNSQGNAVKIEKIV
jgi:predicted dehydrogenase